MKDIVNAYENRLILKQAEIDGLGSELLILQQDCIQLRIQARADRELLMRCWNKMTGIDAEDWGDIRTSLFDSLKDDIV